MSRRSTAWSTVALTLLAVASAAAPAQPREPSDREFRVTDIQARLLYEHDGSLSGDITADPNFTGFNTMIGEGSAAGPAADMIITAVISGPGEHNLTTPLVITARDERGRVIGTRRIGNILTGRRTYRSMVLYDSTCAGTIRLTAQLGASVRNESISLDCGE